MAREVGVAVIGLGYWGPNLLRVLGDNLDARVRWIYDLDRQRLGNYRCRHQGARVTTRVERVLADPDVDAVSIVTPVHTHHALAAQALAAGKHVFVEKPLAPSNEFGERPAEMAAKRDRILMCGHTFLYTPPVGAIKRMIDEGKLGDIYFISSSRVSLGLHQRDVNGHLGPRAPRLLDPALLAERDADQRPRRRTRLNVKGIADVAFITMTFDSGIVVNVELSWLAPGKLRRTVLVGSERMAIYDDGVPEPVRLYDRGAVYRDPETFGECHLSYRSGDVISPKIECKPLSLELGDFVNAIRSGERMDFHTALACSVVRLVDAAEQSQRRGGREVFLEQDDAGAELAAVPGLAGR